MGLRLCESPYRLPPHLESLSYRLILDVLSDARQANRTSAISVSLGSRPHEPGCTSRTTERRNGVRTPSSNDPVTALDAETLVQPSETGVVCLALNSRRPIHSQYLVPEGMSLIP